jgi:hypothetical protein
MKPQARKAFICTYPGDPWLSGGNKWKQSTRTRGNEIEKAKCAFQSNRQQSQRNEFVSMFKIYDPWFMIHVL